MGNVKGGCLCVCVLTPGDRGGMRGDGGQRYPSVWHRLTWGACLCSSPSSGCCLLCCKEGCSRRRKDALAKEGCSGRGRMLRQRKEKLLQEGSSKETAPGSRVNAAASERWESPLREPREGREAAGRDVLQHCAGEGGTAAGWGGPPSPRLPTGSNGREKPPPGCPHSWGAPLGMGFPCWSCWVQAVTGNCG